MSSGHPESWSVRSLRARVLALVSLVLAAFPAPAYGHADLVSSEPPSGARVSAPPREIRLRFDESPELAMSRVEVRGPRGSARVGRIERAPGEPEVLVAPLEGTNAPGEYAVEWRTVGRDGHPMRGRFEFTVLASAAPSSESAAARGEEPAPSAPTAPDATEDAPDESLAPSPTRRIVPWVVALALAATAIAMAARRRHRRSAA